MIPLIFWLWSYIPLGCNFKVQKSNAELKLSLTIRLWFTNSWFACSGSKDYFAEVEEFAFNDDTPSNYTYTVRILEDAIVEEPEDFTIVLQVPADLASRFSVQNHEAEIQINDNDGEQATYTISCCQSDVQ